MSCPLLSLSNDLLLLLTTHLHTIKDFLSLSSSCSSLHSILPYLISPSTILALCNAQSGIFFRPNPHFLVLATASQLGAWARRSPQNEALFASTCKVGLEGLLSLSLKHCGLTLERIRALHSSRFSLINPVENIIDQCVGRQRWDYPELDGQGVFGANSTWITIGADPGETVFHLAIYGEIFKPDLEAYLNRDLAAKKLSLDTRLEFIKYCIPDWQVAELGGIGGKYTKEGLDPRRLVELTGPYKLTETAEWKLPKYCQATNRGNMALSWTLRNSRWRVHWLEARRLAGTEEFAKGLFDDDWWFHSQKDENGMAWRQALWENVMVCQGLDGYGMMWPELREGWYERIREWRRKIEELEGEDDKVFVGDHATFDYPYLVGDLNVTFSV